MLREKDFQHGYDKGFTDGQLVVQHSKAFWEWTMLACGIVLGFIVHWMVTSL